MGHIGNAKSIYGRYFSLVNPETNEEMEAEMCFNFYDSHVYGNWFYDPTRHNFERTPEEKIILDRLYELAENGLINNRYVWEIQECMDHFKYICVKHRNQLLKCEECRDFTRKLKLLINAGDLDYLEVEKEIFANHVVPWKRGKKIEPPINN